MENLDKKNLKPSVFPTPKEIKESEERAKIAAYEAEKKMVTSEVYSNAEINNDQSDAISMMRKRTEEQMRIKEQLGVVKDASLFENTSSYQSLNKQKNEEQLRLRDEQLIKNKQLIDKFQKQTEEASIRKTITQPTTQPSMENNQGGYVPPKQPPTNNVISYGQNPSNINQYIVELSQPNYNSAFDVIPLPSKGKLYQNKKQNARISFMTTADENILTSPNLLQSGEFLEILINRKLLEQDLRYKDLHVGDRNAIMIWLRATGYGEMYPVTLLDENDVPFDTEINLHELKVKNLGAEPDAEGLFDFTLPTSKVNLKFKLLTCGDIDDIEKMVEQDKLNESPINNSSIYKLEKSIVEVNGNRNKEEIKMFIDNIRIMDGKAFNDYVDNVDSGIDLNIEIQTPGGGSIKTFLPLNINFFWPNFGL
jgi:hypothetical protein